MTSPTMSNSDEFTGDSVKLTPNQTIRRMEAGTEGASRGHLQGRVVSLRKFCESVGIGAIVLGIPVDVAAFLGHQICEYYPNLECQELVSPFKITAITCSVIVVTLTIGVTISVNCCRNPR